MEAVRAQIALSIFREEQAAYPEKLEEVVPDLLARVPIDPFTGEPLGYVRTAAGKYDLSASRPLDERTLPSPESLREALPELPFRPPGAR